MLTHEEIADGWKPMDDAPRDGTDIQAIIPGHGTDNVIAWVSGYLDEDGQDCCTWAFTTDQEPPDCWTDGVCWDANEDGVPSVRPTAWKPLREEPSDAA